MSDVRLNLWLPQGEYDRIQALAEQEKRSVASMARYLLSLGCDAFQKSHAVGLAPATAVGAIATVLSKFVAPLGRSGAVAGADGATGAAQATPNRRSKRTRRGETSAPAGPRATSVPMPAEGKTKSKKLRRMIP